MAKAKRRKKKRKKAKSKGRIPIVILIKRYKRLENILEKRGALGRAKKRK